MYNVHKYIDVHGVQSSALLYFVIIYIRFFIYFRKLVILVQKHIHVVMLQVLNFPGCHPLQHDNILNHGNR